MTFPRAMEEGKEKCNHNRKLVSFLIIAISAVCGVDYVLGIILNLFYPLRGLSP